MTKRKSDITHQDEIRHIKEDIDSLKSNVVALTKTVRHEVADTASDRLDRVKKRGRVAMNTLEKDIKSHPVQSVATAFGAGIILSALLRRR